MQKVCGTSMPVAVVLPRLRLAVGSELCPALLAVVGRPASLCYPLACYTFPAFVSPLLHNCAFPSPLPLEYVPLWSPRNPTHKKLLPRMAHHVVSRIRPPSVHPGLRHFIFPHEDKEKLIHSPGFSSAQLFECPLIHLLFPGFKILSEHS